MCGTLSVNPYKASSSTKITNPSIYFWNINIPESAPIITKYQGRKTITPSRPNVYTIRNMIRRLYCILNSMIHARVISVPQQYAPPQSYMQHLAG